MPYLKISIRGTDKQIRYVLRKDGRYYARINKGIKDFKDDGTPVYDYANFYAPSPTMLQRKIVDFYTEEADTKESKEIFTSDIVNWLRLSLWKKVEGTTYDRDEEVILNQIIPAAKKLRHKRSAEITVTDCKEMLNSIYENTSESTYKKACTLLRAYFDDLAFEGTIAINPARFKERGSKSKKRKAREEDTRTTANNETEIVYLEDDEIEKVKKVIEEGYDIISKTPQYTIHNGKKTDCKEIHEKVTHNTIPQGKYFIFMMNTGLRAGEACALKYSDIDFEKGTMKVNSNIKYEKVRDEKGNAVGGRKKVEGQPKTPKSHNKVQINAKAISILKEMLKEEPEGYDSYIVHDTRKSSDAFAPSKSLSPHALYKRWQTVCKYAGIEPKGLHCLRHTCASHLFAATNGNAVAVSELLRHTDVSFTEKYYIDIINEYRKQIISEFEI